METVCGRGRELGESPSPGEAFADWLRVLAGFLATKRGLSHALISSLGKDSELISSCGQEMRATAEQLLDPGPAGRGGPRRPDRAWT